MLNTKRLLEENKELGMKIKSFETASVISNATQLYETYSISYNSTNVDKFQFIPTTVNLTSFKSTLDSLVNTVSYSQLLSTLFPIELSFVGGTDISNVGIMFLPNTTDFTANNLYTYSTSTLNGYNIPSIDTLISQGNNDGAIVYFPASGNFVRYFQSPTTLNGATLNQSIIGAIDQGGDNLKFVFGYEKIEQNKNYTNPNVFILPQQDTTSGIIRSSDVYDKSFGNDQYDRQFVIHLIDNNKKFILYDSNMNPFTNIIGAGNLCICKLPGATGNVIATLRKNSPLASSDDYSFYPINSGYRIYPTLNSVTSYYINGDATYSHLANRPITAAVNVYVTQQYIQQSIASYKTNTFTSNTISHEGYTLGAKNYSSFPGFSVSTTTSKINSLQGATFSSLSLSAAGGTTYEFNYVLCRITKLRNCTASPLPNASRFIDYVLDLDMTFVGDFIDYIYAPNIFSIDKTNRDANFKKYQSFDLLVGKPFDIYNFKYDQYLNQYTTLNSSDQLTMITKLKSLPQASDYSLLVNAKFIYKIEWSQLAPLVPLNLLSNTRLTLSLIGVTNNSRDLINSTSSIVINRNIGWPITSLTVSNDFSKQTGMALPCIISGTHLSTVQYELYLVNSIFFSQYAYKINLSGYTIASNQGAFLQLPLIIKNLFTSTDVLNMYDSRLKDEFSFVIIKRGDGFSQSSMNTYNSSNIGNTNFLLGSKNCSLQYTGGTGFGNYYTRLNGVTRTGDTSNSIFTSSSSTCGIMQLVGSVGNNIPCIQNLLGINSNIIDGLGGDSFINRSFGTNKNLPNYVLITQNLLLIDGKGVYGNDMIREFCLKLFNDTPSSVTYDVYCVSKYFCLNQFLKSSFLNAYTSLGLLNGILGCNGTNLGNLDLSFFSTIYSIPSTIQDIISQPNLLLNYSKPKILVDSNWTINSKIPVEYFIYPMDLFIINSSSTVIPSPPYIFGIETFGSTIKGNDVYYRNLRIPSILNLNNYSASLSNPWRLNNRNISVSTTLSGDIVGNGIVYYIIIPKNLVVNLTSLIPNLSNLQFSTGEGMIYMPKVSFVTTPTYGDAINHQTINGFLTTNLVNYIVNLGGVVVKSYSSNSLSSSNVPTPNFLYSYLTNDKQYWISDVYYKNINGEQSKIESSRFFNPMSTNLQLTILGDLLLDSTTQKPICRINPLFGFNTYAISLKGDLMCQVNNPISENSMGHLTLGRCINAISTANVSGLNNTSFEKILYGSKRLDLNATYTNLPTSNNLLIGCEMCIGRENPTNRVCEFILVYEDNPSVTYTYNGVQMTATQYLDAYIEGGNLAMGYMSLRCPGNDQGGTYVNGGPNSALNYNFPSFSSESFSANIGYHGGKGLISQSINSNVAKACFPDNVQWYMNNTVTTPTASTTDSICVKDVGTHFKSTWMQYMKQNGTGSYVPSVGMLRFMNGDSRLMSSSSNTALGNTGYGYTSYLPTGFNNPTAFTNYYNSGQGFEFNSPSIGGHVLNTVTYTPNNNGTGSGYTFTKYTKTKVLSFFVNEYKLLNSDVSLIHPGRNVTASSQPSYLNPQYETTANYSLNTLSFMPMELPGVANNGATTASGNTTSYNNDARFQSGYLTGEMFGCFGQIPKVYYHEQAVRPDTYTRTHTSGGRQNYQLFSPDVTAVAKSKIKKPFIQFGNKSVAQELPFVMSTFYREYEGIIHDEYSEHILKSRVAMFKPRSYPSAPSNFIWTDTNTNKAIQSASQAHLLYTDVNNTTLGTGSTPQYSIYKGLRLKEDILNYIDTGYNVQSNFVEIMGNKEKQVMDSLGSLVQITGPTGNGSATNQYVSASNEFMIASTGKTNATIFPQPNGFNSQTNSSTSFPVIGFAAAQGSISLI